MKNQKQVNDVKDVKDVKQVPVMYSYNGVVAHSDNKALNAVMNKVDNIYNSVDSLDTVELKLTRLGAIKSAIDSANMYIIAFKLLEIENDTQAWQKSNIKKSDYVDEIGKRVKISKKTYHNYINAARLCNKYTGKDKFRQSDNLDFPLMYIFTRIQKKDANRVEGADNLDYERIEKALTATNDIFDENGKLVAKEYAIKSTWKSPQIEKYLRENGYLPEKPKTAKADEKADEKAAENTTENAAENTAEKTTASALTIAQIFEKVVKLCNDNGATFADLVKYNDSISK